MGATVKLFGLCGVGSFNNQMLAVMPASVVDGKPHRAFLSAASKDCVLAETHPDFIFYDQAGVQQIGWNVDKKRLRFKGATGNATWSTCARERMVDLKRFHQNATIKLPAIDSAILELTAGSLSNGPEVEFYDVLVGTTKKEDGEFSISIRFRTNLNTLQADGTSLVTLNNNAVATLSNLAALPNGHEHFHHYYEFFDAPPAPSEQVSIVNSGFEIFDCVPPAPLP
jgi:hypothetical protein